MLKLKGLKINHGRILVDPIYVDEDTTSKVAKPSQYEDKAELGVVVGLPDGEIGTIEIGHTVAFNRYSTTKMKVDGKDMFFLREEDVLASQQ